MTESLKLFRTNDRKFSVRKSRLESKYAIHIEVKIVFSSTTANRNETFENRSMIVGDAMKNEQQQGKLFDLCRAAKQHTW